MSHELFLLKSNNTMTNITPIVGDLSWRSNIDELGTELNFSVANNDIRHFPKNPIGIGDMVILKGKEEITRCIVVSEDKQGRKPIFYKAFDPAFYLNKSRRTYQFNNISTTKAITQMLNDYRIPIAQITNIATKIDQLYINETISDIIRDILEQAKNENGKRYTMEMNKGKFNLYQSAEMVVKPRFNLANNLSLVNGASAISNPSRRRSIENMRNNIQIVCDNKVVTTLSDQSSIQKYGMLSDTIEIQADDISKARNIARNTLNELGRVFEENSIEMIGDNSVLAGRTIEIEEPVTGMTGRYLIKNVVHNVRNGIHKMSLELGVM